MKIPSVKAQALLRGAAFFLILWLLIFRPLASLPDISALEAVAAGEPRVPVRDLSGNLIYEYTSPVYGEKIRLSLDEISDAMIAATLATEDSRFFTNPGFSPAAMLRAAWQNMVLKKTFSGASTITQQVVRNILLSPDERYAQSFSRKLREILLAAAVTLRYDKETILSIYLNEMYYGALSTGVGKAAEVYFGKGADELSLAEAAFIAGMPQAPNYYSQNTEAGQRRTREVLRLMERDVNEGGCIPVRQGRNPRSFCPTVEEIRQAGGTAGTPPDGDTRSVKGVISRRQRLFAAGEK